MPLLDQIQKDIIAAMKGREEARLDALRMIKTALKKLEVLEARWMKMQEEYEQAMAEA